MENTFLGYVQDRILIDVKSDRYLSKLLDEQVKNIILNGNNMDSESELIDFFNNEYAKSKLLNDMIMSIGKAAITHAIDKEFMDDLVKVHFDNVIEDILEGLKEEYNHIFEYSLEELEEMETIAEGQFSDLKEEITLVISDELKVIFKVRLSRMTVEDGEEYNNKVFVIIYVNGNEHEVVEYQAK